MLDREEHPYRIPSPKRTPFRLGILALIFAFIILFGFSAGSPAASAAPSATIGYRDMYYKASGVSEPTAQKPQSKLWYNDGQWWGDFYSTSGGEYRIYALDWETQVWSDTGVALDDRENSWADVLWDGTYLYVASGTSNGPGRLYRYTYSGGQYQLSAGFPVQVTSDGMEALVMAKDSTGTLWITYTKGGKVYVAHSNGSDSTWNAPYVLPVAEASGLWADDISSIVAYDGYIGVMWSNQTLSKMVFAAHVDGAADNQWQSASTYTLSADDHINLKSLQSDGAGNVFAVVKTSFSNVGDPGIVLLACTTGNCTSAANWQAAVVFSRTVSSQRTRPILLLDTSNRHVYVFMAGSNGGPIRYKRTSIDAIDFTNVSEVNFIEYTSGLNDPTSTKQNVNSSTGLVVAASDGSYYYHNCMTLTGATECPDPNATPQLKFSAASYSAAEGDGTATIEVQRLGALTESVTVDYASSDGTAVAGSDYTAVSGTLTFGAGQTTKTFTINIANDTLDELDETAVLTLSNPVNLTNPSNGAELGAPDTSVLTITDDDDPPAVQFSAATYTADEGDTAVTIDVTLDVPSGLPVTVDYTTADDTATAGSDYTATSGTLTFTPGQTSRSFSVPILEDNIDEANETVNLLLDNATNATIGATSAAALTIVDNEPPPVVSFETDALTVNENVLNATVNVVLSSGSGDAITVDYTTTDSGTATAGDDYLATSGTLTFAPGETSQSFTVTIFDNIAEEAPETIGLALSNPQNAELGMPDTATLTILDDDIIPKVTFKTATRTLNEGTGSVQIEVLLSEAAARTITVNYAVIGGSALPGLDFTAVGGTLTFAPGETSQSFTLEILEDALSEGPETILLSLSSPSNAELGTPQQLQVTIRDNDTAYVYIPLVLNTP